MLNDRTTLGAGLKLALPACEAVMVHEPAPVRWTVLPLIVQLPVGVNVTVRPDEAVAFTSKSASPKVLFGSGFGLKVIV